MPCLGLLRGLLRYFAVYDSFATSSPIPSCSSSIRPMHPSQLGDRSREGPGRGFIRCVEDQEAFITSHSVGGCVHPSQISHLIFAAVLCSAFARSLAADV